jgi:ppGpp synthetase/RelA/SpoT-type nucleotidyltranferase
VSFQVLRYLPRAGPPSRRYAGSPPNRPPAPLEQSDSPCSIMSFRQSWYYGRITGVSLPSGLTKNQIHKLGKRIAAAHGSLDPQDQKILGVFLDHYSSALQVVHAKVEPLVEGYGTHRGFELRATSRLKNTETIREKIRRDSTNLARMEDVAGVRVVDTSGSMTRYDQDEVCQRILTALGPDCLQRPRIDRRAEPRAGYRVVHLVVQWEGVPIEIQVRTALQDAWAQVFEGMGDSWGRGDPLWTANARS